ncbi:hypothetical protein [Streptomyces sp. NPDC093984]|uniref:hypothetical protein n=1 Tax=Streptomyces sp. NPDC093984 TaxID=3366052 RepID=UPI0038057843
MLKNSLTRGDASLPYPAKLAEGGVERAEIAHSGQWPMYANAVAMWDRIAAFVRRAEEF